MENRRVVALGFFDGVHLGHGGLLTMARRRADELGLPATVMTFDTHPDNLVFHTQMQLINSRADRVALMQELYGMDEVQFFPFDAHMMQMDWRDFIQTILVEQLHAAHVVCGHDYHFGYRGQGNPQLLRQTCAGLGIGCDVIDKIELDGITVSSTYIRTRIAAGDMAAARRFLGHPHRLSGTVVHGHELGRRMGTPTANLIPEPGVLAPRFGVYITRVTTAQGVWPAVTNVGCRPTVDGENVTVEPWLLDFSGDLYGQHIRVEFYEFLRPEERFDSVEQLRAAILRNAEQTRAYFAQEGKAL